MLYVYVIPLFVSAALARSRAVAIWHAGMKRKNILRNAELKMAVSCVKCDLISSIVF